MLLFVADSLACFPYQTQDEPLFIMHHIDITLSVSGSNLLQSFKEVGFFCHFLFTFLVMLFFSLQITSVFIFSMFSLCEKDLCSRKRRQTPKRRRSISHNGRNSAQMKMMMTRAVARQAAVRRMLSLKDTRNLHIPTLNLT